MLFASTIAYASNPKACPATTFSKGCKAVATLCKLKTCKHSSASKPVNKAPGKTSNSGSTNSSPADTYENYIAPFIKAIAPHFYDRILKKDDNKLPDNLKSKEA